MSNNDPLTAAAIAKYRDRGFMLTKLCIRLENFPSLMREKHRFGGDKFTWSMFLDAVPSRRNSPFDSAISANNWILDILPRRNGQMFGHEDISITSHEIVSDAAPKSYHPPSESQTIELRCFGFLHGGIQGSGMSQSGPYDFELFRLSAEVNLAFIVKNWFEIRKPDQQAL
ncbi:hypothetical protein M422DRAFT_268046 [Sphaerobolus stellatus SS14]|uniref:Uncharacterized protein n=1 Tax=Sphaerobolus stellatus (strain SS14) TaxID=990650 RepID=A0A0C9UYE3_SPHS4|nr:hypothetical protein M422DRAFT_268046 [Sphaerobolus stellatus SS14]